MNKFQFRGRNGIVLLLLAVTFFSCLYGIVKSPLKNFNVRSSIQNIDSKMSLPKCSCRDDEEIYTSTSEERITFEVKKKGQLLNSFDISKSELNSSKISCSPFKSLRRGLNQKVISYSIFGTDRIYYRYLKDIVKAAKKLYPDWILRIYHDGNLTEQEICELECFRDANDIDFYDNIDFCDINELTYEDWHPGYMIKTFWRWLPIGDTFIDYVVSRDTDSCLIDREKEAVEAWMKSDKLFHIMRDHPLHDIYMLAGLWGQATAKDRNVAAKIFKILSDPSLKSWHASHAGQKQADQIFLSEFIYKEVKKSVLIHDSFHCVKYGGQPFPTKRPQGYCHVGAYGCCGPESSNYIYAFPYECPHECRPAKDWVLC